MYYYSLQKIHEYSISLRCCYKCLCVLYVIVLQLSRMQQDKQRAAVNWQQSLSGRIEEDKDPFKEVG